MRAKAKGVRFGDGPRTVCVALKRAGQRARKVRVPVWVAFSCSAEDVRTVAATEPLYRAKARHQTMPETPGHVMALANMYRPHVRNHTQQEAYCASHKWTVNSGYRCPCTWTSRCQVPLATYHVLGKIRDGLNAGRALVENLEQEIRQTQGSVGVAPHMRDFLGAAACCWDWSKLLVAKPEREQVWAFLKLQKILLPYLRHTLWPNPETHPTQQDWNLSDQAWAKQYLSLCNRVRAVAARVTGMPPPPGVILPNLPAELLGDAKSWMTPGCCTVLPVWVFSFVHRMISSKYQAVGLQETAVAAIAGKVSSFLGQLFGKKLPETAWRRMELAMADLVPSGCGGRKRQKRTSDCLAIHPVMTLRKDRKLVYIVDLSSRVNAAAVCQALDKYPFFTTGAGTDERPDPNRSAFHATRIFHRCRVMRAPEAACEHMGSLAHHLWQPSQGLDPSSVAAQLLLAMLQVRFKEVSLYNFKFQVHNFGQLRLERLGETALASDIYII